MIANNTVEVIESDEYVDDNMDEQDFDMMDEVI